MSFMINDKLETEYESDQSIIKQLQQEQIIFSQNIQKYNDDQIKQERKLVLTNLYIYNFKTGKFGLSRKQVQSRKIHYSQVQYLILSKTSNEVNINIPQEFEVQQRDNFLEIFIKQFHYITDKDLPIYFVDDKQLEKYQMSKKDVQKKIIKEPNIKPLYFNREFFIRYQQCLKYHQIAILFAKNEQYFTKFETFEFLQSIQGQIENKTTIMVNKDTQKKYLMFKLLKSDISLCYGDEIEYNFENPYIMPLQYVFHDQNTIFFLVDKYEGKLKLQKGKDLFQILQDKKRLDEQIVQYIFIQIFLCLSWMHDQKLKYLQLCPENIFIDTSGNIMLQDVYLSNFEINQDNDNYYCVLEYASPEMLKSLPSYKSDFWALGILLYEMVYGLPPFYNQDRDLMTRLILTREVIHLQSIKVTDYCKDMINKLLIKDPEQRLNSGGIMGHPWLTVQRFDQKIDKRVQFYYQRVFKIFFKVLNKDNRCSDQ